MKKIWEYLKNRSAVATYAVLTVALLGMAFLLISYTATASHPAEDTRMTPVAREPSSPSSVSGSNTCCHCTDGTWQLWIADGECGDRDGNTGACKDHLGFPWVGGETYERWGGGATCGTDCSNAFSTRHET